MKAFVLLLTGLVVADTALAAGTASVGPGSGVLVPGPDSNPCPGSALFLNDDGTFENGYAWQYGGVVLPDLDGFGGMPRTRIAAGIGYPTGWQDPSIIWGPTQALGLGPWCAQEPIPVERATWGRVKNLYR